MRWDPLYRTHAVIAEHRQTRTYLPPEDRCPLCPSRDGMSTEIPAPDYEVVVFENRFPAFALQAVETVPFATEAPFRSAPGAHRHRRLGGPDAGPRRARVDRVRLLLREPRRGDRRDAVPPARADQPTPYIAGWQQAPSRQDREVWHLAAEILTIRRAPGKLTYLAGSESGAGVWINDVTPEDAAARLRAADS